MSALQTLSIFSAEDVFLAHKAPYARKTISAKQETGRVYLRHQHAQQDYDSRLPVLDLLAMLLNVHFQQLLSIGKRTILLNLKKFSPGSTNSHLFNLLTKANDCKACLKHAQAFTIRTEFLITLQNFLLGQHQNKNTQVTYMTQVLIN